MRGEGLARRAKRRAFFRRSADKVIVAAAAAGLAAAVLPPAAVQAAPVPAGELEQRCWQNHTRERTRVNLREPQEVSFSNLRDGYRVASPVLVQFAVRGMGVAPAGVARDGTGHHHILINRPLPSRVGDPIPFDDTHRHYGAGQTEALLELPAGRHTLRLLFADHDHRPHFVYSREIAIQVLGPRAQSPRTRIDPAQFERTCAQWHEDEVSRPRTPGTEPLHVTNIRAGEALTSPFNLRFGVEGFGVCARGIKSAKCGYFLVELYAGGRLVQNLDLVNGATQMNAFVGVGEYRLRLRFVNDQGGDMLPPHELPLRVVAQERG